MIVIITNKHTCNKPLTPKACLQPMTQISSLGPQQQAHLYYYFFVVVFFINVLLNIIVYLDRRCCLFFV